ncbi:SDR family NAD(P)-dependent oxidoreductase [Bdellovibrio sp. ZAP7]|uniref:dTDP-4-dehydrorhamnose reductase family protein n=1 Tax=Bdellovibrio sp. ZAP7 TaxID=2231053 RepID=UPI001159F83F|nr:SDR family oxidoreductase [Bdellovibrio sp. ZAP7]QDK45347.1 SDR family NAD(P)-dependent oxidoreductase [Bdellovibrio sp. ZAP7]
MKVLVLGAAGMLGHQVWLKCLKSFGVGSVAATLRKSKSHYDNFGIFKEGDVYDGVDVSNFESLSGVLTTIKPTIVVNCIGLTLRKEELGNIEKCIEVNSMLPHKLELWGKNNDCRVIHFSTDCVFDGARGNYSEYDVPSANDLYGKSKFLGEVGGVNALTLRLSIVGRELEGKTELIEWFLSQSGRKVNGYSRFMYSGLTTNFVADEVVRLIRDFPQLSGVYHVSSEYISKYDLLVKANEIYHCGVEVKPYDGYVGNKTLNCERYAKATGFVKPSWDQMLRTMNQDSSVNYGV